MNPDVVVYSNGRMATGPSCEAVGVYRGLSSAEAHPFRCVEAELLGLRSMGSSETSASAVPATTERAEYATELNGSVRLVLDGEGVRVGCHYQEQC